MGLRGIERMEFEHHSGAKVRMTRNPNERLKHWVIDWKSPSGTDYTVLKSFRKSTKEAHSKFFKEACDNLNKLLYS